MRRTLVLLCCCLLSSPACAGAASSSTETPGVAAPAGPPAARASQGDPSTGRFQLVVVPGNAASPFLLDTMTGCLWHQVQNQETKRITFVEVDVENLHWSWGSGTQGVLAARIDAANLTVEQKRALKEEVQKTACGLSHVVLTPGMKPATGAPSSGESAPPSGP